MAGTEQLLEEKNILILHGDDAFSIEREVKRALATLGSPTEVEMNSMRLDGKTASMEDIHNAVTTLPFFGDRRLVVLTNPLGRGDKTRQEKLTQTLEGTPPSTTVILIVEDHTRWRKDANGKWNQHWDTLSDAHWLTRWVNDHPQAENRAFALPETKTMHEWVLREAKEQGGKLDAEAAQELAAHVGNETSIASQEIAKLLMYVNFARPVTREDVIALVSEAGTTDAFAMVDALVEGRTREAQQMIRALLDDTPPEVVLGTVVFRIRQLIQVREALEAREDLKTLVDKRIIFGGRQTDVIRKQAQRFSLTTLKGIYHRLLEMDVQSKTSQTDLTTNLEMLVVELGN